MAASQLVTTRRTSAESTAEFEQILAATLPVDDFERGWSAAAGHAILSAPSAEDWGARKRLQMLVAHPDKEALVELLGLRGIVRVRPTPDVARPFAVTAVGSGAESALDRAAMEADASGDGGVHVPRLGAPPTDAALEFSDSEDESPQPAGSRVVLDLAAVMLAELPAATKPARPKARERKRGVEPELAALAPPPDVRGVEPELAAPAPPKNERPRTKRTLRRPVRRATAAHSK